MQERAPLTRPVTTTPDAPPVGPTICNRRELPPHRRAARIPDALPFAFLVRHDPCETRRSPRAVTRRYIQTPRGNCSESPSPRHRARQPAPPAPANNRPRPSEHAQLTSTAAPQNRSKQRPSPARHTDRTTQCRRHPSSLFPNPILKPRRQARGRKRHGLGRGLGESGVRIPHVGNTLPLSATGYPHWGERGTPRRRSQLPGTLFPPPSRQFPPSGLRRCGRSCCFGAGTTGRRLGRGLPRRLPGIITGYSEFLVSHQVQRLGFPRGWGNS